MGEIFTFTPRPRPPEPVIPKTIPELTLRARIEAAAEVAIDTAERLIAILDGWEGDADLEPDADAEPSLPEPLPWGGDGNVVAAAGAALLAA